MKIKSSIILLIASVASAQHPRDFVSDDALSVLSIQDGNAVNAIIETIYDGQSTESENVRYLDMFIAQMFVDPTAVDLSSEFLISVEPTVLAEGQRPTGMFGPMPHLVVMCKAKEGRTLKPVGSMLKSSTTVDGWFVASGADEVSVRTKKELSPIFAFMPNAQIGNVIRFNPIWQKFGQIAQMVGGMYIGTMNKPDLHGVISPEQRKQTAAAGDAFRKLTAWCGTIENISVGVTIEDFELTTTIDVETKEKENPTIDNDSLLEMASYFTNGMFQYAMSSKLTKKLLEFDADSLEPFSSYASEYPALTEVTQSLAKFAGDNVVGYNLDKKNGLTIACLADAQEQNAYLVAVSNAVDDLSEMLLDEYSMKLTKTDKPFVWDVSMNGSDAEDQRVMNAVVRKGNQLRFRKQGESRVGMMFGPVSWRGFSAPHSTALMQVIKPHAKNVDVDFACSVDARRIVNGFADVANIANPDESIQIPDSPSAKWSLLFGATNSGTLIEIKTNLLGLVKLISDIDIAQEQSRELRRTG